MGVNNNVSFFGFILFSFYKSIVLITWRVICDKCVPTQELPGNKYLGRRRWSEKVRKVISIAYYLEKSNETFKFYLKKKGECS